MFTLPPDTPATLHSFRFKDGGLELELEATAPAEVLDRLAPGLCDALFDHDGQQSLEEIPNPSRVNRVRFPELGPVSWSRGIPDIVLVVRMVKGTDTYLLTVFDAVVRRLFLTPLTGGMVTLSFRVQGCTDFTGHGVSVLAAFAGRSVTLAATSENLSLHQAESPC